MFSSWDLQQNAVLVAQQMSLFYGPSTWQHLPLNLSQSLRSLLTLYCHLEFSKPVRVQMPDSKHGDLSQEGFYKDMKTLATVAPL